MIRPVVLEDIPEITNIQLSTLPEVILPRLGQDYLEKDFYPQIIQSEITYNLVNDENGIIFSFCVFAQDSNEVIKNIIRNKLLLARYFLTSILKNFRIIDEVLSFFSDTRIKLNFSEVNHLQLGYPEIFIMATKPQFQRQGLGSKIVEKGLSGVNRDYSAFIEKK